MVLAGDFNMNLDGTRWYGLQDVKRQIRSDLEGARMKCCTLQDMRSQGMPRANVDHIWVSDDVAQIGGPAVWFGKLSDHNGVSVELDLAGSTSLNNSGFTGHDLRIQRPYPSG
ncbi:MAG: endonuclease/Exonuclease/phosphatase family protein [Ramlibacter sp.]|jgi:endonuclease/exonuclease/phosphatase family metal-dependent hydrolase|nr:endonuclease/Exonuclease/phosphatase family protein [Ramlibacter sp.]